VTTTVLLAAAGAGVIMHNRGRDYIGGTTNRRRCTSQILVKQKVFWRGTIILVVSLFLYTVFYITTPIEKITTTATYPYDDGPIVQVTSTDSESLLLHHQQQHGRSRTSSIVSCLIHRPVNAKFEHIKSIGSINQSLSIIQQPSAAHCGHLRRDWTGGRHQQQQQTVNLYSSLAREIEAHQSNCSLPTMDFYVDNDYGLGSHLVLWSQALCNAWESNHRIRTVNPDWLWLDRTYCKNQHRQARNDESSPLSCYFPKAENKCPHDVISRHHQQPAVNVTDPRNRRTFCKRIREATDNETLCEFRRASMEYIFQQVSPLVIAEAERQLGLLFPPNGRVPNDLITVHVRWGDKFWEMDLASIPEYMDAVERLLQLRKGSSDNNETVHIYLATEDPRAVQEFLSLAPAHWKVYVDRTVTELNAYRPVKGNRASWTSRNTQGRAGLVALGSLLVALEAQSFVLTTKSNWSRLMDALRLNVIDAQCGNCTRMIDLRPGDW
jgi:hypothetical protein